jgi:hypothetical protein
MFDLDELNAVFRAKAEAGEMITLHDIDTVLFRIVQDTIVGSVQMMRVLGATQNEVNSA